MQWTEFKSFLGKILQEGRRLQKVNIAGKQTTTHRWSHTQLISFGLAIALCLLLPTGINDNFAEYAIAFLGIFVGLFTSVLISLYEKGQQLYVNFKEKSNLEKARINLLRNYLVQFTGLTAYSIILALLAVALLLGILLFPGQRLNIWTYRPITSWQTFNWRTVGNFIRLMGTVGFRFVVFSLLLNFFAVTLFALSSYFSFLLSEYKKIGLSTEDGSVP
jgi:hypothetical protein